MPNDCVVLALNETRKTVLASRVRLARERADLDEMLPGDGVWLEPCERLERRRAGGSVDLVFVDDERRVVETMTALRPGATCPGIPGAAAVLQLAPGTIPISHTQKGDQILIERVG